MREVRRESRPNRAMNHGAPAATTTRSGCAGSVIRSAPRSRTLRRTTPSMSSLVNETVGRRACQSARRRRAAVTSGGSPWENTSGGTRRSSTGVAMTLAEAQPCGGTSSSMMSSAPSARAPGQSTTTSRRRPPVTATKTSSPSRAGCDGGTSSPVPPTLTSNRSAKSAPTASRSVHRRAIPEKFRTVTASRSPAPTSRSRSTTRGLSPPAAAGTLVTKTARKGVGV